MNDYLFIPKSKVVKKREKGLMSNVHKILILGLVLFFTSSSTSRAEQNDSLTWLPLILSPTNLALSTCDGTHLDLCDTEPTCTGENLFSRWI